MSIKLMNNENKSKNIFHVKEIITLMTNTNSESNIKFVNIFFLKIL